MAAVSLWRDYLNTTFDPAHLGAEATFTILFDVVIGAVLWPLVKRAVRRHDREEHGATKRAGGSHD